jgi:hypothetical protein
MPTLDKKLFTGGSEVTAEDWAKLEVRNFSSDLEQCLKEFGWQGNATACIGLSLSADNRKVERGDFLMVGPLGEFKDEAAKLWLGCAEDVTLVVKLKTAAVFQFPGGSMSSDVMAQEALDYAYYTHNGDGAPSVILEADYEEYGIGNFCVKAVCGISKNSSVKEGVIIRYVVLLFPNSKEELCEKYAGAREAAWPGLLIAEGECPMMMKATAAWGCPIYPLVLTGENLEDQPRLPSGDELRAAIAAIMASATAPETSRTVKSLHGRWRKLAAGPDELVARKSLVEWPTPQQSQNDIGK